MKKVCYIYWVFPVSQFLMIYGSYSVTKGFDFRGGLAVALSLVADAIIFYLLWHAMKKEEAEEQLKSVILAREAEARKHAAMEKSQSELIAVREELEKRFADISKEHEDSNIAADKIEEFQKILESTRQEQYTENAVINAVIGEKKRICESELEMAASIDVHIPASINVSAIQLCSLFSNLLDNAIEALREIEKSERRLSLNAVLRDNYVIIKVENSATEAHVKRKRRDNHGYGTKIIKSIVEMNGGTYNARFKDGSYVAMLMLKA